MVRRRWRVAGLEGGRFRYRNVRGTWGVVVRWVRGTVVRKRRGEVEEGVQGGGEEGEGVGERTEKEKEEGGRERGRDGEGRLDTSTCTSNHPPLTITS